MLNCPFCELSNKTRTIAENKFARVIFSNPRLTEGHLLVTPKRHVEQPWTLEPNEREDIFELIDKYQKILAEQVGTGCDVRQNYRPFIDQGQLKVNHLHYHLIPRTLEDEIYLKTQIFERDIFKDLSAEEITMITKSID